MGSSAKWGSMLSRGSAGGAPSPQNSSPELETGLQATVNTPLTTRGTRTRSQTDPAESGNRTAASAHASSSTFPPPNALLAAALRRLELAVPGVYNGPATVTAAHTWVSNDDQHPVSTNRVLSTCRLKQLGFLAERKEPPCCPRRGHCPDEHTCSVYACARACKGGPGRHPAGTARKRPTWLLPSQTCVRHRARAACWGLLT